MKKREKSLDDMLSDYCRGNISDDDLLVLKSWMEEDREHHEKATRYLKLSRTVRAHQALEEIDADKALLAIMARVRKIKRQRRFMFFRSAAAIAVVLIGLVFVVRWYASQSDPGQLLAETPALAPGKPRALLIFEDGSRINLEGVGDSAIVRNDGTTIRKNQETIDYRESSIEEEVMNTLRIPRGGEYILVLSDGTKVWLNADSELSFPVKFLGKKREISLLGEAYFEVAENREKPFVIHAQENSVEVLGTAFNLRSYADEDRVETTLVKGSVKLNTADDKTLVLSPGQQGIIAADHSLTVKNVDTRLYTSWKDGMFTFKSMALEEIMKTFSRWYDIEVVYENEALKQLHFTGNMKRYEEINPHLRLISFTTNVDFEIEDHKILVKNK